MAINESTRRQSAVTAGTAATSGGIVLKKPAPDALGAKRLATRYGGALVCVRYREDAAKGRRLTPVEPIIDERPLPPPVAVRIAYEETGLRSQVKAAGGVWDSKCKLWRLPRAAVRQLKLAHRIIPENAWKWITEHIHIWKVFSIYG